MEEILAKMLRINRASSWWCVVMGVKGGVGSENKYHSIAGMSTAAGANFKAAFQRSIFAEH